MDGEDKANMDFEQFYLSNNMLIIYYIIWFDILRHFYYVSVSKRLILGCYFFDDFCMVVFKPFWGIQTLPVLTIT